MDAINPTIIKLGGSVVTDKYSPGIINFKAISELSVALATIDTPLILIHGAGSLGHPEAQKWRIADGLTGDNAPGIYETHDAVSSLNHTIVKMLRDDGINAISFPPFASALATDRRLIYAGEQQLTELLKAGITPVLYGDTVMDTKQGVCIVSGDQLVQYLAQVMHAERVGIVTECGGVLQDRNIVHEITPTNVNSIEFTGIQGVDVTGGMKGKVTELLQLATAGIPSQIFGPENLKEFLEGGWPGTHITNGGSHT